MMIASNGTNGTTPKNEELPFAHSLTVDATAYIILILALLAVVVNFPVTLSLLKSWKKLLFSDILLLQIFASNLLLGIGYALPIYGYFAKTPIMSMKESCTFTGYYVYATALVNISALQILSCHQYIIIKRPMLGYHIKKRKDYGVYACIISVAVSLLIASPPLFGWSRYTYILDAFACELDFFSDTLNNRSYSIFSAIVAYFMPLINMVYCGVHCIFLRSSRADAIQCRKRPLDKRERKLTQSIFAMFLGFMITWSPYAISCFFSFANGSVINALHVICVVFAKMSASVCSLIYFFSYKGNNNIRYTFIVNMYDMVCSKREKENESTFVVIGSETSKCSRPETSI